MPATTQSISNTVFAWINYVLTSELVATSAALAADNLKLEIGSSALAWQTQSGVVTAAGGARLEIRPPFGGQLWRAFGLFRTNLTNAASVNFTLYNNPSTMVGGVSPDGPEPGFGQVVGLLAADTQADYAVVTIDDPSNPDGFINIPLLYAGPVWQTRSAPDYQTSYGSDSQSNESTARGGQEYVRLLWSRRRAEIALNGIRADEVAGAVAALDLAGRNGANVLYVPDITSPTVNVDALYGRLIATADVGYPYAAVDRRSWRARITERL